MNPARRAFEILALTLGLLTLPSVVSAQQDYHGGPLNARQHGYQHGYRDGYESGRGSNLSNREQDQRNQRLQTQGNGYQPSFGSEADYSQGYREGFDDGSRDVSNGVRSRLEELFRWQDPRFTLAYLAGHSDFATTRRYVHPQSETVLAAMEKVRGAQGGHTAGHTDKLALLEGTPKTPATDCIYMN